MFKKKPKIGDLTARRDDLAARLSAAEDRLTKLRAEAVAAAGVAPEKLGALSESAFRAEFEINALRAAIEQAEHEAAEQEEAARREADRLQREATARELHALADTLELAVAPLPDALEGLRVAITAAQDVIGDSGFTVLLGNLRDEVPAAMKIFVAEIRGRAAQTLTGTAPATLPKPFVPTIIKDEPLPETVIFVLNVKIAWPVDGHGKRAYLGAYQIGSVPEFWAKVAMERGLAIDPTGDRYKAMRAEAGRTGWPHIADEMAVRDLDRDPNAATFYNRVTGKKVRDEIPKFENYRENESPRQVGIDVMLPK
jgi:hypothetical protein